MNNDSNNINSSNDTIGQINNTIEGNKTLEINISNQPVSNVNSESNSNIYIIEQPEQHQNIAQISNTNSSNYGTKYSNETSVVQNNQTINNGVSTQQTTDVKTYSSDDEFISEYVGKNYKKINGKPFNISAFFFTSFYLFYRKMFCLGLIVFLCNVILINVINNSVIQLAIVIFINLFTGFLFNKVYMSIVKRKVSKIKKANSGRSSEQLKAICLRKGGTSIGGLFLGILVGFCVVLCTIILISVLGFSNILYNMNENVIGNINTKDATLVENVSVVGSLCIETKCNISIEDSNGNTMEYVSGVSNDLLFNKLVNYKNYIKMNIYYIQNSDNKTLISYKIFLKSNNKDISDVKTENELREKIGLYSIGIHTDSLTLSKIGTTGVGFINNESYTYNNYIFVSDKNIEYEMKYINDEDTLKLTEGNNYTVTFEVTEGTFGYDFIIKSIK